MPLLKHLYLIVFLSLVGCTGTLQQPDATLSPTQRSQNVLPPTWTLTPSLPPTETPVRAPTLTFTPLPSATLLPPTITTSPTSNVPTSTGTPTKTPKLVTDCYFWAVEEGVEIHPVPFEETFRLLPTMIPSVTYQAITYHPTFYELMLDGESVGWADYRLLSVQSEGPGCSNLPFDDREAYEFPSLCFFTTKNDEMDVYEDRELTLYFDTISSKYPHRILLQYKDVYYSKDGMPAPGYYVDASQINTLGDCESVPKAGTTIADIWLWSKPNGQSGEQVASLVAGSQIYIQEGPVDGIKPPEASEMGSWYLVMGRWQKDGAPFGWIWSTYFRFE